MNKYSKAAIAACAALAMGASVGFASFTENFQDDTPGVTPAPNWSVSGTNGTSSTANVATEGTNVFLAVRDFSSSLSLTASRDDVPITGTKETSGFLQFDIRFNQGVDAAFTLRLYASKPAVCASCYQPITLSWFHNANNTNNPLIFRSQGNGSGFGTTDPNAFAPVTNNFPIGTWESVRVAFVSRVGDPRGTYSVSWNGITNNYFYLNQNDTQTTFLAPDRLSLITAGMTTSVDIDNIQFIPEPTVAAMIGTCGLLLLRRRSMRNGSR